MANPDWTRDELILALDLYFQEPSARGSKTHPAVIELSELSPDAALGEAVGPDHWVARAYGQGWRMTLSTFDRLLHFIMQRMRMAHLRQLMTLPAGYEAQRWVY